MNRYTKQGEPLICPHCEYTGFREAPRGNGRFAIYCDSCYKLAGYRTRGVYDQHFRNHHDRQLRRALRDLWRATRSLLRAVWRNARGPRR